MGVEVGTIVHLVPELLQWCKIGPGKNDSMVNINYMTIPCKNSYKFSKRAKHYVFVRCRQYNALYICLYEIL